jgi:hypothetical protein
MGVGVIAGGVLFVGQAGAAPLVDESFESSPSAKFGAFASYAYSQNYTSANTPPNPGLRYFTGTKDLTQQTHVAAVNVTDPVNGVPAAAIDAGLGRYDLSAWFSGYMTQADFSEVRLQFQNDAGAPIGAQTTIGGQEFVAGLGLSPNADDVAGYRDWGLDSSSGIIPAGARSANVTIFTQRAEGIAADGYLDLVRLDVSQVPEPGLAGVAAFASSLVLLRRRRRGDATP